MLEQFRRNDRFLGFGSTSANTAASTPVLTSRQMPVAEVQPTSGPAQLRYSTRLVTEPTMVAAPR